MTTIETLTEQELAFLRIVLKTKIKRGENEFGGLDLKQILDKLSYKNLEPK